MDEKLEYPLVASVYLDDDRWGIVDRLNRIVVGVSANMTEERARWVAEQLSKVPTLEAALREKDEEIERGPGRRKHTQDWYAAHYGKLHDWARKRLPEPWRNEFFSCIANGTYSLEDRGEPYVCNAGFTVTPSGYMKFDSAQEQILHDQSTRAENAEAELSTLRARVTQLERQLAEASMETTEWKSVAGEFAELHEQDCGCLPCKDYRDALSGANRTELLASRQSSSTEVL